MDICQHRFSCNRERSYFIKNLAWSKAKGRNNESQVSGGEITTMSIYMTIVSDPSAALDSRAASPQAVFRNGIKRKDEFQHLTSSLSALTPAGYRDPPGHLLRAAGPPGAQAHPTSTVGARVSTALTRASLFNMRVATTEVRTHFTAFITATHTITQQNIYRTWNIYIFYWVGRVSWSILHSPSQPLDGTTGSESWAEEGTSPVLSSLLNHAQLFIPSDL